MTLSKKEISKGRSSRLNEEVNKSASSKNKTKISNFAERDIEEFSLDEDKVHQEKSKSKKLLSNKRKR